MSSITTDQGIVHYEVYGRGRPVILLHGWLGSWGLWQDTMTFLGKNYRTYALDFWGFGESGKKRNTYQVTDFVDLVNQFMELLGIESAPLIGHSMGGTVSLMVALRYPKRVERVAIIGSPIHGSSLAMPLKLAGKKRIAFLLFHMMGAFRQVMRWASPLICKDPRFPDMMDRDLSRTTLESFLISIDSLHRTDLRHDLQRIQQPLMGIFGSNDNIVDFNQWQILENACADAQVEKFMEAGHFVMLDAPEEFNRKIKLFLDGTLIP